MKPQPIHLVISHIKGWPLGLQIQFLRELLKLEKPFSVRRNELESLLRGKLTRQLKRESRAA